MLKKLDNREKTSLRAGEYSKPIVSDEYDECPMDGEIHPDCEHCIHSCARGEAILRMREAKA